MGYGVGGRIVRVILVTATAFVAILLLTLGVFRWQAHARETKTRLEAAPAGGRFVRAADVDVFVQELGPADAPVVLFVHGMGAWSELWRETLAATAAAGFRAVALDLPPFGFSERPTIGAYGRQPQARRILGVIDALGVERVTLVGHSFGGGPTMEAVLLAPQRVRALVLADAAIGLDVASAGGGPVATVLSARALRNAVVSATATNPLLSRSLLARFVARPAAVTDARVRVLQQPLVVQGATDAFGDWLRRLPHLARRSAQHRQHDLPLARATDPHHLGRSRHHHPAPPGPAPGPGDRRRRPRRHARHRPHAPARRRRPVQPPPPDLPGTAARRASVACGGGQW